MYRRESDISCLLLEEENFILEETQVHPTTQLNYKLKDSGKVWKLYFDGANSREGNGARVPLVSPNSILVPLSFKLEFEATNNVDEYSAFLLALQATRNLNIECMTMYGDFEIVVKKIKNQC